MGGISLKEIDATLENHFLVLKKDPTMPQRNRIDISEYENLERCLRQNVETANADQERTKVHSINQQ